METADRQRAARPGSGSGPVSVAVLIPCYNEEVTIGKVVRDFRAQLPEAAIYVFDNGSTDGTVREAGQSGAIVRHELRRGKGYVIRSMFRQVEAEIYVMVDGDDTYPADRVHELIRPVASGEADLVTGARLHGGSRRGFRIVNLVGNRLFLILLNALFRVRVTDLLSGYRVMSRRLVKGLPFLGRGFESETELTVKALERGYRMVELPVDLVPRPAGSHSKIHIVRDGLAILGALLALVRDYKPLTCFGLMGAVLIACGWIPGFLVVQEFLATGRIQRLPSAVLAVGLMLAGLLIAFVGLVLHSIARRFQELDYQLQGLLERRIETGQAGVAMPSAPAPSPPASR